jgi:Na+/melibiose symporter-like transporter
MLPCCAIGALFIMQTLAVYKWFKRVVLRKPQDEDEEEYWRPEKPKIMDKFKSVLKNPNTKRFLIFALAFELILVIIVWSVGGFEVIQKSIETVKANPDVSLEYIWDCCFGN